MQELWHFPDPPPPQMQHDCILAVDFAFSQDYTAAALIERRGNPNEFFITHLHRWKLGTRPTPIVEDIARMMTSGQLPGPSWLVCDKTGIGVGPTDALKERLVPWWHSGRIKSVNITAGSSVSLDTDGTWNIAKLELASVVGMMLGT